MGPILMRRALLRLLGAVMGSSLAAACRSASGTPAPATPGPQAGKPAAPTGMTLTLANSELVVGPNRFAMAVLEDGRPVASAGVKFEFFQIEGQNATKRSEADAVFRSLDGVKGIYVAKATFDRPGSWGVQASVARADRPPVAARSGFEVVAQTAVPTPGTRAIPSRNPTAREVANLAEICSAQPPCDMHELSIAEALALGKPLMVAFATPGYCTSQTCAPVLGEVQKVKARRAERASFVHVEIYKDPRNLVLADAVTEWHLETEPWVFAVDRAGVVVERVESITTADELDSILAPLS
jgi:hypothetical protein